MEQKAPLVFISYSSKEEAIANELVAKMHESGIECWIASRNIPIGSDYTHEIPEAIESCPYFLILLSHNSLASKYVEQELVQAFSGNKYLFPLLLEADAPVKAFDFILNNKQSRPYYKDRESVLEEVVGVIRKGAAAKQSHPRILVQPKRKVIPRKVSHISRTVQNTPQELYLMGTTCAEDFDDMEQAVAFFEQAAREGHADSLYQLGNCYRKGKGVAQDKEKANRYYLLAAHQGHAEAQYWLGFHYMCGDGIKQDYVQARKWLECSRAQGFEFAQICIKLLDKAC